ncbi:MAG: aldo/keto reductase [Chloroflexi bacterium]|nr:aldo/keto reductase [Chloroflexota bacterium]
MPRARWPVPGLVTGILSEVWIGAENQTRNKKHRAEKGPRTNRARTEIALGAPNARQNRSQGEQAGEVLNTALDNGINPLDTASCYVNSEEFVGATVAHRRDDYVPATKAGHAGLISEGRNPVRPARRRLGATGVTADYRDR